MDFPVQTGEDAHRFQFRDGLALSLLLALGLLLRVGWLFHSEPVPVSDFLEYRFLGSTLFHYGQLGYPDPSAARLPGFPFFLAGMMLIDESDFWLSLTNIFVSVAIIAAVHQLAYKMSSGNRMLANTAGLLCAINPTYVFLSPVLASEPLFTLLLVLAVILAIQSGPDPTRRLFVAGLMLGAATLTRGEGLFYLPAVVIASYVGSPSAFPAWRRVALVSLATVILIGPWYARNYQHFGPGVGLGVTGGLNFYFAHSPDPYGWWPEENGMPENDHLYVSAHGIAYGLDYIRTTPGHLTGNILEGSQRLMKADNYASRWSITRSEEYEEGDQKFIYLDRRGNETFFKLERRAWRVLVALAALALLFRKLLLRASWAVIASVLVGNWVCFALIFWAKPRFRFAPEAFLCVLGAVALVGLISLIRRKLSAHDMKGRIGSPHVGYHGETLHNPK
ncbi:MAG: hypothetical protein VX252_00155 [Myxococcota bacterium]|nr:hypothetical protein [Myxococcota bacterium]